MSRPIRLFLAVAILTLLSVAAVIVLQWNDAGDRAPLVSSSTDNELQIERGRYLALAGNCASCHTSANGELMAGGVPFRTPFGTIYSTNITPDPETGIGDWTIRNFLDSMRRGVRPNGEHLYPVFPYTAFTKVTDEDIAAIFAFLNSLPAVRQEAPPNELSFPFNLRSLMYAWKAMFFDEGVFEEDPARSEEWNRGAYMVEALAHCGACHSPRNIFGAERSDVAMAGGVYLDRVRSGEYRLWSAPNLTSTQSGLGLWPHSDVAAYLKTGRNEYVETFGPMNKVIMHSTRHLRDDDVNAMAEYLKSLPPSEEQERTMADSRTLGRGKTIYNLHCGTCHLPTGLGDETMAPRLGGGSLVVRAEDPTSLINVILYGPEPAEPPLPEKWLEPMEEFQYLLDDEEVAAVASFLRHSWDNPGGAVTPDQVARQR